ncbi:antitoxin [Streptomyces sp. NPDC012623]|uniref:antitoxin n=1 Tax=unclassified Streptomyces TaxID=2593676 RepID=UPI00368DF33C
MSMLDKLKSLIKGHEDTARQGVEKGGDAFDRKTDNKYQGQVDTAQKKLDEQFDTDEPHPGDRPPNS